VQTELLKSARLLLQCGIGCRSLWARGGLRVCTCSSRSSLHARRWIRAVGRWRGLALGASGTHRLASPMRFVFGLLPAVACGLAKAQHLGISFWVWACRNPVCSHLAHNLQQGATPCEGGEPEHDRQPALPTQSYPRPRQPQALRWIAWGASKYVGGWRDCKHAPYMGTNPQPKCLKPGPMRMSMSQGTWHFLL
jgi:hypothetical protein